jgi:hypothetical protein
VILSIIDYWAGTSKNLGQESGYTESSYQFSHLRKNTRSEMATEEVYSDAKRQRTTKPFGEVSMSTYRGLVPFANHFF